ncbi:MAG TPA: asparagine synthetase B [Acetobacteraceae bacterium]|nr:asparagine synthetase B [Acetobacteraceae bacterium]
MCGIAVAIDWPDADAAVRTLIAGIRHRGDITDPAVSPWPGTVMCTRRLRIVDGARAIQPQLSFDGRLAVSFNGEIYNHAALRHTLEGMGIAFRTASDTEVLANALRVWGHKALARIVGMYAFVAVDIPHREFVAARDPFGVKPLYTIQSGDRFLFCSEIQPLLDAAESGDVMLVPPGYLLTGKTCAPFRSPVTGPTESPSQGSAAALDEILREAVRTRLPPDLPFALMFSGGIDSTLIAHYARQFRPEAPGYFLGSAGAPDHEYAAEYADLTGLDLRFVEFDAAGDEVFARIEEVVQISESFDPNCIRGAICSLALAARMHEDGYRVALCGEGADELFCGYAPLEWAFREGNDEGRPMREEFLGLMHRVSLQRVDRCSMRFQIETREPFLDPAIVRHAKSLDRGALVRDTAGWPRGKEALRSLYDLYPTQLPERIRDRRKMPFGEGSGLDVSPVDSPWKRRFDALISDRELHDAAREFAGFDVRSKEELYYLRMLSRRMDVRRVPHLRGRAQISFRLAQHLDKLKDYAL